MYSLVFVPILLLTSTLSIQTDGFEEDVYTTDKGDLKITFIGHGTLMVTFDGLTIHVDPVSRYADYSKLPKADLILITHDHGDHLDIEAIQMLIKSSTDLILTENCKAKSGIDKAVVMKNGAVKTFKGIKIEAVPAYNLEHMRSEGVPFHPKGEGNAYILNLGAKRIFIGGDTENTPEMKTLKDIDIAFLPMNLPYTMTPEMVADAAKAFRPKVLYPYHFGNSDPAVLEKLLEDSPEIKVVVRKMN